MLVMTTMQWRKRHLSKGGSEKEVGGENLGFCRIVHTQKLPGGSLLIRAPGTILQHSGERQIVRFDSSLLSSFKDNLWCSPLCRFYPVVLQIIVQGVDRVAADNKIFRRSNKNDKKNWIFYNLIENQWSTCRCWIFLPFRPPGPAERSPRLLLRRSNRPGKLDIVSSVSVWFWLDQIFHMTWFKLEVIS